ncbi:hypothetical protein [Pyxidicoccus xibeiensis]|uniref:hypothetical protein n=1 Tax=Pyxidicoccus xibeiensis TaxID=2906759 RepID=UPI0020A6F4E1|nr:hypothetical protein [Pyxidicoccus xibeiensis]MCP3143433.1 hypothetical protein [Pyxidicoccus xibeiensis]
MIRIPQVEVSVVCTSEQVAAEVRDRRPDSLALFGDLGEGQREQLVLDAWSIGFRALHNAHTAAQEAKLKDVGEALVSDVDRQLRAHVDQQQEMMASVLRTFFDPKDGQVTQRLAAFVEDQGVLARLLDRYLGPGNSVLAEALARQVGETSPLFKKLSLTESDGLVKVLEGQLRVVMNHGHAELVRALDPLAEDGAVARFLRSLREELKGADEDRAKQLSAALAALNANDENSLLSRLVRETHRARQEVLSAVNPDAPDSPMSILKASLTKLLQEQGATQGALARQQEERQARFEKEVREALARIETRRAQEQKSTRGGLVFEDAVVSFLQDATRAAACVLDVTGATAGIGRCKKGDAVLRFTDESAFAGACVVFEAKRDATYTVQKALDELDAARKNREAVAGVFVMARSHASETFPRFMRYGSNVLVSWDEQDPATDAYLQAAVLLGMALVTRSRTTGDTGDITALRDVETRIEAELTRLEKVEKYGDAIRKNVDGISDEVRKARKALDVLLRKAQDTLQALKVELHDEGAERGSPIGLPNGAFRAPVLPLPGVAVASLASLND